MTNLLRTTVYQVAFFMVSLLAVLGALAVAPFGGRAVQRLAIAWSLAHNVLARILLGIRPRIEGARPALGPVLYAVKHEAAYETLALLPIVGNYPAVVLKEELTRIPLWGRVAVLYGVIPVNRSGSASALRTMLTAARKALGEGRSILIFPEGTRVASGERPPLRPGFAGLYRALGLPVVPVALNSGQVWPREGFAKRPGVITIRFGEAIPPGLPRADIEARVHAAINVLNDTPAAG